MPRRRGDRERLRRRHRRRDHLRTSRIDVTGRFSLGTRAATAARRSTRACASRAWNVADLRHAFALDDYDVQGWVSGSSTLRSLRDPHGYGTSAWTSSSPTGAVRARHGRAAVRGQRCTARRHRGVQGGGTLTGPRSSAGRHLFVQRRQPRMPVEQMAFLRYPDFRCRACCSSRRAGPALREPAYEVRARIDDLFLGDEGVGQVTGRLTVRDERWRSTWRRPRRAWPCRERARALTESGEASDLAVVETSLDPYVRALVPRLSPLTTAVASGRLRVFGALRDPARLRPRPSSSRPICAWWTTACATTGPSGCRSTGRSRGSTACAWWRGHAD